MWPVMAQSHPWTNVPSVDGAPTTVGIIKMQESCAKVGRCMHANGRVCVACVALHLNTLHTSACAVCASSCMCVCAVRMCILHVGRQIEKMWNYLTDSTRMGKSFE